MDWNTITVYIDKMQTYNIHLKQYNKTPITVTLKHLNTNFYKTYLMSSYTDIYIKVMLISIN